MQNLFCYLSIYFHSSSSIIIHYHMLKLTCRIGFIILYNTVDHRWIFFANQIFGEILTKTSILKQNCIEDDMVRRNWQNTVRRFYFGTPVFALFLCEILIKVDTQFNRIAAFLSCKFCNFCYCKISNDSKKQITPFQLL